MRQNPDETAKAALVRKIFYGFEILVLVAIWAFDADLELDLKLAIYLTSILVSNILMVEIRKNPGMVTYQVNEPQVEVTMRSDDLDLDQRTNYQLGATLRMRELQDNLLEPEVSLRSPYNIADYEDDNHSAELDRAEIQERYGSVETIREGQY